MGLRCRMGCLSSLRGVRSGFGMGRGVSRGLRRGRCGVLSMGGLLLEPQVRQAVLLSAYASIVEATEVAVDALIYVASKGRSELARVQAAREILDRAGLSLLSPGHPGSPFAGGGVSGSIDGEARGAVLDRLLDTLDSMNKGLTSSPPTVARRSADR